VQNIAPSNCATASPNGRRIALGLCLAIVVAIASIATIRTTPVRTAAAPGSQLSSDTSAQGDVALSLSDGPSNGRNAVRARAVSDSHRPERFARRSPVFDREARAEFRESVRESMQLSVAKLGDELAMASAED